MRLLSKDGKRPRARGPMRSARLRVEVCEPRCLLAANQFLVTTNLDSGAGSLRQAILDANSYGAGTGAVLPTIIDFAIAGSTTITLSAALPPIAVPTLIDGTSQANYLGTPVVGIDGGGAGSGADGIVLAAGSDGSRVRGLDIRGFASGAAIHVESSNDVIQSNYLGTDATGATAFPNQFGVWVDGAASTTIGGASSLGNLISGNSIGVAIQSSSSGTVVLGNQIGTSATGAGALANTTAGIQITGSSLTTIGTATYGAGNAIAFNPTGVDIVSGTGNAVRGNSIYANGQGIALNVGNGANDGQAPPTLAYATAYGGGTLVEGALETGFAASTTYQVDFYASVAGDAPASDDAHIFLGSRTVTTGASGTASFSFTATVPVPVGQVITATATDPAGNTSQFSGSAGFTSTTNNATVVNAFVVTTNGDQPGAQTGLTSLRQAILNANADTAGPNADTITFAIGTGAQTITLASALPAIAHKVVIDGTTQPGYAGAPVIQIDGNGLSANGLQLGTGSAGSTIKGLSIVHFVGAAIDVESDSNIVQSNWLGTTVSGSAGANTQGVLVNGSNNTIGGATSGAGNTIANNATAVNISSGTGDAVRGNLIYSNASAIVLGSGANNGQQPPNLASATTNSGTTTINGGFSATAPAGTILDFYADASGQSPARVYLGSYVLSAASASFSAQLPVSASTLAHVSATSTAPTGDTSEFSSSVAVTNPFLVTINQDSGFGSLRQAILNANADTANPNADTITFAIGTGAQTITLASALPAIAHKVVIDGTTQPGYAGAPVIQIDGNGLSANGLQLGTGSAGSTIKGLSIVHFVGAAIDVESDSNIVQSNRLGTTVSGSAGANTQGVLVNGSSNTIGGATSGAGNTIANNATAVNISSGTGDAVRGNLIYSNASAIVLGSGANNGQQPPTLSGATSNAGSTTVNGSVAIGTPSGTVVDFYANSPGQVPAFTYLGSYTYTGGSSFTAMLSVPVTPGLEIVSTETTPSGDTSEFSGTEPVASPFTVTNTSSSGLGSLNAAIAAANASPPVAGATDRIVFNILTLDSGYNADTHTFTIALATALPNIMVPITLDGTSELTFLSGLPSPPSSAIIAINGGNEIVNGLVVTANTVSGIPSGSLGSTITALTLTGFTGDAIQINTSNNTIGGNAPNLGNTIEGNGGNAVHVVSGSGNTIRENLIYNNTGSIVYASTPPASPTIVAAASVTNLTTIDYSFNAASIGNYTVDFYASSAAGGPAALFLGTAIFTATASTTGVQPLTANFNIATALVDGQTITATLTGPDGGTSEFAAAVAPRTATSAVSAFAVTNATDNAPGSFVGSLRQAILDANNSPAATGNDNITFDAAYTISPTTALPIIGVPVTISGTNHPGVTISGLIDPTLQTKRNFNGLVLGAGSDYSKIWGLSILDFGVNGLMVQSSNNIIGGTSTNQGNTIGSNSGGGVVVASGNGNIIHGNTYLGANGPVASVEANDIVVASAANGGIQPAVLVSASLKGTTLSLAYTSSATVPLSLDVYRLDANQRAYLGTISGVGGVATWSGASNVALGDQIIVSQTYAINGQNNTSAFSGTATIVGGTVVTNTNSSGPGSFSDAINNATQGDTVTFDIPDDPVLIPGYNPLTGTYTISLTSQLPNVRSGVTIDGTSQPGFSISTAGPTPIIQIDGGGSDGRSLSGLVLEGSDIVQGLSLFDFTGDGNGTNGNAAIVIGSSDNKIMNNWIGVSPTLSAVSGNTIGILVQDGATGNTIGGTTNTIGGFTVPAANVIGLNQAAGVKITGSASGNTVWGNYFGTDAANHKLGNAGPGVLLDNASYNSIGAIVATTLDSSSGMVPAWFTETMNVTDSNNNLLGSSSISALGNIFGFNGGPSNPNSSPNSSICITGAASMGNTLIANWIGTNGGRIAPSAGNGIEIDQSKNNTIGSSPLTFVPTVSGTANFVLSGPPMPSSVPQPPSISVVANVPVQAGAIGNVITANASAGISLNGATSTTVTANSITANASAGISLNGATSTTVTANSIAGNTGAGINVSGGDKNTIGGAASVSPNTGAITALGADANLITDNGLDGVNIGGGATNTTVQGNLISRNAQNGIEVNDDLSGSSHVATIADNFIGTDAMGYADYRGNQPYGNGLSGVLLASTSSTSSTTGTVPAVSVVGNIISSNGLSGVTVQPGDGDDVASPAAASVSIKSNLIGTDESGRNVGSASLPSFGNVLDGIRLDGVAGVIVGAKSTAGNGVGLDLAESDGNLIAGNLGRGIELVNNAQGVTIGGNLIGVVFNENSYTQPVVAQDPHGNNTGNLSDGIFLNQNTSPPTGAPPPLPNTISGNVISANRGYGIHAAEVTATTASIGLTINGNFIGTANDGSIILSPNNNTNLGGNGADGIFLDSVTNVAIGGTGENDGNLISCNRADGIDLLGSSDVTIAGNRIGTNRAGNNNPAQGAGQDYGNSGDGIFINQSSNIAIGDANATTAGTLTAASNIISGNRKDGIFISGTSASALASGNRILGNYIGLKANGSSALPNSVAGIILSNAGGTAAGLGNVIRFNVISGNQLDGILLANTDQYNRIDGNLIGTDATGNAALGNGADGIFLIGAAATVGDVKSLAGGSIANNTISNNAIAGNTGNGVQIFGAGASGNTVSGNRIGLGLNNLAVPNGSNGVFLNNAGATYLASGGASEGAGNLVANNTISGNLQSGVLIMGGTDPNGGTILGGGNLVQGNRIGTDATGAWAVANGANGVFIYGSKYNVVGGATATPGPSGGVGNLISGNSQAGVSIFSPSSSAIASGNLVTGNLIGTNAAGNGRIGNNSDGIDIFSGQGNCIGGAGGLNVISGNVGNGVLIAQLSGVPATGNALAHNDIGTAADGSTPLGNAQNGVLVNNASWNAIGLPSGSSIADAFAPTAATVANVISANGQSGIQFLGSSPNNTVQGNYIGVNRQGNVVSGLGNAGSGVYINSPAADGLETIGGTAAGAGNVIAGNSYGINILGSQIARGYNTVQGNLIGIDINSNAATDGNGAFVQQIGVFVQNSASNTIGSGNAISGNSQAGVEILGQFATGNQVANSFIGTDIRAAAIVADLAAILASGRASAALTQNNGVYVLGATFNTIGPGNIIGGNLTGVSIQGQPASGSAAAPPGNNFVVGNLIGTNANHRAVPNFEYGVLISNSAGNTIGGAGTGQGNTIASNGIAGVEIFGGTSQSASSATKKSATAGQNRVLGNAIGLNLGTSQVLVGQQLATPDGPIISLGAQLYGVVVIGSSNNAIGAKGAGNTIAGNTSIGVYITRRDFPGSYYSVPTNNVVSANAIANNGHYGVLRYEAPANPVAQGRKGTANRFSGNPINVSDYIKSINSNTSLNLPPSRFRPKTRHGALQAHHKKPARHVVGAHRRPAAKDHHRTAAGTHHRPAAAARPRVPALFRHGAKLKLVAHVPAHHHR